MYKVILILDKFFLKRGGGTEVKLIPSPRQEKLPLKGPALLGSMLVFSYKKNVVDRKKIKMKITNTNVGYLKSKCRC